MIPELLTIRKSLNKAYLKVKPTRSQIETFKANLTSLFGQIKESESEEYHKNVIAEFLKNTYFHPNHYINTKGRTDLVIHNGKDSKSSVGVIIETKKPGNRAEMPTKDNLNSKAVQELVLYYLRERITQKNLEIKFLIATDLYDWFIFNAQDFEKIFVKNKKLVADFEKFEEGSLSGTKTDFFYNDIAKPFIASQESSIPVTWFDIRNFQTIIENSSKEDDTKLIGIYKILSPEHLLKLPFSNDSNTLDKRFYNELLHIIGLEERKEGSKKLIGRKAEGKRDTGSLIENAINILNYEDCLRDIEKPIDYGETKEEQLYHLALELSITWINRILFLKLLEGQLVRYHNRDEYYKFLNAEVIPDFDALNKLFFHVLAVKENERGDHVKEKYKKIPYLNSSLFEPNELEHKTIKLSNLEDDYTLPILGSTVLKDNSGKKKTGEMNPLHYLLDFLDSYDFSSEGAEDISEENKTLINASVLGLIFEKINGYKDGSFFTPGFITMYMCRETIRRAVVKKFNDYLGYSPHPSTPTPDFGWGEDLDDERDNMNNEKYDRSTHPDFSDNTPHPPTPSPELRGGDEPNDEQSTQINNKLNRRDLPISKMERGPGGEDIFSKTVHTDLPAYLLNFARDLRKNQTPAEEMLWQLLRNRQLNGYKFRRQHPIPEGIIIDFYCAETKIAVELDGQVHKETLKKEFDKNRTERLANYGIEVIRFWNDEVINNPEAVLNKINQVCSERSKPKALENIDQIYNLIGREISITEANKLINSLKICDPAVGSGHFLVSALNEIIAIKSELKILSDKNGKLLRDYHVEVVNDELVITDEEGEFFEYHHKNPESQRIQETLFREKQTIIENCLFGVDINQNSVKICRLRLWIELLKNAYYKPESNFTELETLPNIDINIKCGNSLISRYALDADIKKALQKSKWSIDSYRAAVMTYRNAENKSQKAEMRSLINQIKSDFESEVALTDKRFLKLNKLKGELDNLTNQTSLFSLPPKEKAVWKKKVDKVTSEISNLEKELEEIRNNKIYEHAFEWRFEFPEVLNDVGDFVGFDVVIGNPPYVNFANLLENEREFYNKFKLYKNKTDLYAFFAGLAGNIKNQNGFICLIIPHTWVSTTSFYPLRKLFLEKINLMAIVELDFGVFKDAYVKTVIIQTDNKQLDKIKILNENFVLKAEVPKTIIQIDEEFKINLNWNPIKHNIYTKIKTDATKLGEIIHFSRGIKTSNDKRFLFKVKNGDDYFKVIRGRNIKAYRIDFDNEYIWYRPDLMKEKVGCLPHTKEMFLVPEKIITQRVNSSGQLFATYDDEKYFCLDTTNVASEIIKDLCGLKFIVGLINSKLINWWFNDEFKNPTISGYELHQIPVKFNKDIELDITKLVVNVLINKKLNIDTSMQIEEIDQLIYKLYDLTDEEIKIIENSENG